MFFKKRSGKGIYPVIVTLLCFFVLSNKSIAQDQKEGIQWYSMKEAQLLAKQNGKKVLAYAEASWCVYCKKMDKEVFPQQAVIDSLNAYYYPVRIDIESDKVMVFNEKKITQQQFARKLKVRATPTTFFVDKEGNILGGQPGFLSVQTFSNLLGFVGSGAFQKMDFKLYVQQHTKTQKK